MTRRLPLVAKRKVTLAFQTGTLLRVKGDAITRILFHYDDRLKQGWLRQPGCLGTSSKRGGLFQEGMDRVPEILPSGVV